VQDERKEWDQRYAPGTHGPTAPDPFFVQAYEQFVAVAFPNGGEGLDVAGGLGRHAVWLAQHGWRMSLIDISEVGVQQARQNALRAGVEIDCNVHDLRSTSLPEERFDLVTVFFYLERTLFAQLAQTLRPGGLIVYKTYTSEALRRGHGPSHRMHLLEPNELLKEFEGLRVLYYREPVEGNAVAELVARKK